MICVFLRLCDVLVEVILLSVNTINLLMFNIAAKIPHEHFANFSGIKLVALIRQVDYDQAKGLSTILLTLNDIAALPITMNVLRRCRVYYIERRKGSTS